MKKLLFLTPIALWSLAYFAFQVDISKKDGLAAWWLTTDMILCFGTIVSFVYAVGENFLIKPNK